MDETWTLSELVEQVERRLSALPAPKNGQIRAVPDDRTIRYYGTLGLLDRPAAMRGRTALYGRKHLAQVVAIKRMQSLGRSLSEIQAVWPTMDGATLGRMAGVELADSKTRRTTRKDFWKPSTTPSVPVATEASPSRAPAASSPPPRPTEPAASEPVELRVPLAANALLAIALPDDLALTSADLRAIRAAAAPLIAELVRRQLVRHDEPDPQGEAP